MFEFFYVAISLTGILLWVLHGLQLFLSSLCGVRCDGLFDTPPCLNWVAGVVWNVLRATCCSYVSSFLHFQGSAFLFQCIYAPPHPVKKCVVLCVRGLLCFVDPSLGPTSSDAQEHCPAPRSVEALLHAPGQVPRWALVFHDEVETVSSLTTHSHAQCHEDSVFHFLEGGLP